jgi:hypothetical protein
VDPSDEGSATGWTVRWYQRRHQVLRRLGVAGQRGGEPEQAG